ncbi:MAG TPA: Bax inhibitor-1/YccA family protein [Flavobacteriales bacterium]
MDNRMSPFAQAGQQQYVHVADPATTRAFLSRVFSYMSMALVLSGLAAWIFGTTPALFAYLFDLTTGKQTILGWVVLLAPLGLVFVMGGLMQRLSATAMVGVFALYSILTGMSISYIFLMYTLTSIASIFFITAAVFGTMAIAGYTTKTDLTKLGSILFIGLIGIVIAGLVNMFLRSDTMGYVISMLSVVIFTGLTAYDMQRLKGIAGEVIPGTDTMQKLALMGALSLYLNFLNLFLSLLRLFGGRRD